MTQIPTFFFQQSSAPPKAALAPVAPQVRDLAPNLPRFVFPALLFLGAITGDNHVPRALPGTAPVSDFSAAPELPRFELPNITHFVSINDTHVPVALSPVEPDAGFRGASELPRFEQTRLVFLSAIANQLDPSPITVISARVSSWGEQPAAPRFTDPSTIHIIALSDDMVVRPEFLEVTLTITLPDATWDGNGSPPMVRVKNVTSSSVTFIVQAANVDSTQQTVDGASSFKIAEAFGWALLVSDGTNWMKFAGTPGSSQTTRSIVTITSDTTLTLGSDVVLVDASSGPVTVTLLPAANQTGEQVDIKKIDSSGNSVTVNGVTSETIDDGLTAVLTVQYEALTVVSDGTEYWIL